jgi:hypothetical protein
MKRGNKLRTISDEMSMKKLVKLTAQTFRGRVFRLGLGCEGFSEFAIKAPKLFV